MTKQALESAAKLHTELKSWEFIAEQLNKATRGSIRKIGIHAEMNGSGYEANHSLDAVGSIAKHLADELHKCATNRISDLLVEIEKL